MVGAQAWQAVELERTVVRGRPAGVRGADRTDAVGVARAGLPVAIPDEVDTAVDAFEPAGAGVTEDVVVRDAALRQVTGEQVAAGVEDEPGDRVDGHAQQGGAGSTCRRPALWTAGRCGRLTPDPSRPRVRPGRLSVRAS